MTRVHWTLFAVALLAVPAVRAQDVSVTVVAIAAGDKGSVDPKLEKIATEVKKHEAALTAFRIDRTTAQEFNVGQKQSFRLIDDTAMDVTVTRKDDSKSRVRLTVKPPSVGEIVYETGYEKFFPILTRHTAKSGERLIVAIMVKPVTPAVPKAKDAK